jgi:hypothetical protein
MFGLSDGSAPAFPKSGPRLSLRELPECAPTEAAGKRHLLPSLAGYRFHGLATSTMVHAAAACGLLLASTGSWHFFETSTAREARVLYVTVSESNVDEPVKTPSITVSDPVRITNATVRDRIAESADQARQRSDAENLDRLDRMAERLNEISDQASIDRMAGSLHRLFGTRPRADQPAETLVDGAFDFATAQFHDVRREATSAGSWRYLSILIDAEGRVFEVELNADDGQRVYETMQRIKQNPLLERVYRKIAMPLFDQMLNTGRGLSMGPDDWQLEP